MDYSKYAFPVPVQDGNVSGRDCDGLTIRDYFAAKALAVIMAVEAPKSLDEMNHLAMRCYQLADAMLAEREKL